MQGRERKFYRVTAESVAMGADVRMMDGVAEGVKLIGNAVGDIVGEKVGVMVGSKFII